MLLRALLSVYDKTGVAELGRGLVDLGYEVVSTGGTLAALAAAGVPVTGVSDVTEFPEILDGRVKSLHPKIHGGLLARRDDPAHMGALEARQILPIDVVAANLYPFARNSRPPGRRARGRPGADRYRGPGHDPRRGQEFSRGRRPNRPRGLRPGARRVARWRLSDARRRALAAKAFAHTAAYDAVVAEYLRDPQEWPQEVAVAGRLARTLRYGENPQQRAAAYRRLRAGQPEDGVLQAEQLAGKELSFNNLLDADAAWSAVQGFAQPAVAIVKHTIPCGLSERSDLAAAFDEAFAATRFRPSAASSRSIARLMARQPGAWPRSSSKSSSHQDSTTRRARYWGSGSPCACWTCRCGCSAPAEDGTGWSWDVRPIAGGLLVQTADCAPADPSSWQVVTAREPDDREMDDLAFAWHAVRHGKSNAIVLAQDRALTGVGSGQPNRLESVRIAVAKAGERAAGSVLASDAFFPFPDGLDTAIAAGVTAGIQPGGSVRDEAVIAAADRAGVAMVFTGMRHFRH